MRSYVSFVAAALACPASAAIVTAWPKDFVSDGVRFAYRWRADEHVCDITVDALSLDYRSVSAVHAAVHYAVATIVRAAPRSRWELALNLGPVGAISPSAALSLTHLVECPPAPICQAYVYGVDPAGEVAAQLHDLNLAARIVLPDDAAGVRQSDNDVGAVVVLRPPERAACQPEGAAAPA